MCWWPPFFGLWPCAQGPVGIASFPRGGRWVWNFFFTSSKICDFVKNFLLRLDDLPVSPQILLSQLPQLQFSFLVHEAKWRDHPKHYLSLSLSFLWRDFHMKWAAFPSLFAWQKIQPLRLLSLPDLFLIQARTSKLHLALRKKPEHFGSLVNQSESLQTSILLVFLLCQFLEVLSYHVSALYVPRFMRYWQRRSKFVENRKLNMLRWSSIFYGQRLYLSCASRCKQTRPSEKCIVTSEAKLTD